MASEHIKLNYLGNQPVSFISSILQSLDIFFVVMLIKTLHLTSIAFLYPSLQSWIIFLAIMEQKKYRLSIKLFKLLARTMPIKCYWRRPYYWFYKASHLIRGNLNYLYSIYQQRECTICSRVGTLNLEHEQDASEHACELVQWSPVLENSKALYASLEGKGGEGFIFFIIQNPPNLGKLKNCIGGEFWRVLEG